MKSGLAGYYIGLLMGAACIAAVDRWLPGGRILFLVDTFIGVVLALILEKAKK